MSEVEKYIPTEEDIQTQEDFFSKNDKDKERALLVAQNMAERDENDRKLRKQVEVDKNNPNTREIQGLKFGDLKKGDVLIFESVIPVNYHDIPGFFDKLDQRIKLMSPDDPRREMYQQITQSGRVILEDAYSRPVGEGRRQLLFNKLDRIIDSHPEVFSEEEGGGVVRLEVLGTKVMQSKGEKREFLLAETNEEHDTSMYRPAIVRIPIESQIEDVQTKLGSFRGRVKEENGRFRGGYHTNRIGKIFYKPKKK